MTTISTNRSATVGKRFVAILVDGFLLQIILFIAYGKPPAELSTPKAIVYNLFAALVGWVYFVVMESSSLQATFGKRLLGIIVANTHGEKISFGRATVRYLGKSLWVLIFISALLIAIMAKSIGGEQSPYFALAGLLFLIAILVLFVGYLMAFFTPEKQALHDIIARCLVVNGNGQSITVPWKTVIGLIVAAVVAGRVISQIPENSLNPGSTSENTNVGTNTPSLPSENQDNKQNNNNATENQNLNNATTSINSETPSANNILGLELAQPNNNLYGVWELEFASGVIQHQALLSMRGTSGVMVVRLPDGQGGTQLVRQNMKLWSSAKGLVLIGGKPVDPKTNNEISTYASDNFLISVRPNNSLSFYNYSLNTTDNQRSESPVERKFIGYPSVGMIMLELTPESRSQINQQGKLPFQLTQDAGIFVQEVETNSTAYQGGIKRGDVILSIDDTKVTNTKQVQEIIRSTSLDAILKFDIDRNGENLLLQVAVGCCVNPEGKSITESNK